MDGRVCARWLGKRKKGRSLGWERPFARETPHLHLRGDYYSILIGMHEMGCAGEKRMVMQYSRDRGGERGGHTFRDASVTVLEFVSRYVNRIATIAPGSLLVCPKCILKHLRDFLSACSRVPFQVDFYILLEADWGKSRFHFCAITLLAVLSKYQMVQGRQDSS